MDVPYSEVALSKSCAAEPKVNAFSIHRQLAAEINISVALGIFRNYMVSGLGYE